MTERPQELTESLIDVLLHELRQPLLCALVLAERLEIALQNIDPSKVEKAPILRRDSAALVSSIYQIRELLSTGNMLTERGYTDHGWGLKVSQMCDGLQTLASSRGVTIELEKNIDHIQSGPDPRMLNQILNNLVLNALDALDEAGSSEKKLKVSFSVSDEVLTLHVEDSGKGVPEDQKEKIFLRGHTTKRSKGGSGIGLWLCRKLSEVMGGKLILGTSPVLQGADFCLLMPMAENVTLKGSGV